MPPPPPPRKKGQQSFERKWGIDLLSRWDARSPSQIWTGKRFQREMSQRSVEENLVWAMRYVKYHWSQTRGGIDVRGHQKKGCKEKGISQRYNARNEFSRIPASLNRILILAMNCTVDGCSERVTTRFGARISILDPGSFCSILNQCGDRLLMFTLCQKCGLCPLGS